MSSETRIPSLTSSQRELPENFALQVLEKELALERQPTFGLVHDMISLYSTAIEHYESQNNPLHFNFQVRLRRLLARGDVQQVVQSPGLARHSPADLTNDSKAAQHMLACSQVKAHSVVSKAQNDVRSQESELTRRLVIRRLKRRNTCGTASDDELLSTESSPKASLHERLETVMEEAFAQKAEAVAAVRVKYEVQAAELQGEGLMQAVRAQLLREMDRELGAVSAELDSLRKQKLEQVKATFLN